MTTDRAKAIVDVDGKQAGAELDKLKKKSAELKKELVELGKANDKSGFDKKQKELKIVNTQMKALEKSTFDVAAVLKNLNGTSLNNLRKAEKELRIETSKLNRETKEYTDKVKQLSLVSKEIKKVKTEMRGTSSATSKLTGFFKSQLGAFTLFTTAFYGISRIFKNGIETIKEFDESIADLRKTTQTTRIEAVKMAREINRFDTKTSTKELLALATAGGRLGLTGIELINFTKQVDKAFVALGDSLDGDAQEIGLTLGKIAANFNLEKEYGIGEAINKVGSSLNELGANSKATEGFIIEFTKRLSGVAAQAEISAPDIQALGALFDETGQSVEVAGTVFNKLLPAIGKDVEKFADVAGVNVTDFKKIVEEDAFEALKLVALGAKSNEKGLIGLSETLENYGIDAARAASIVGVLSKNTDRLTELQKISNDAFKKGTSLTDEFNIKNETLGATQEKTTKSWNTFVLSLDKGNGILTRVLKNLHFSFQVIISDLIKLTQTKEEKRIEKIIKISEKRIDLIKEEISESKNKKLVTDSILQAEENLFKRDQERIKQISDSIKRNERLGGTWVKNNESLLEQEQLLKNQSEERKNVIEWLKTQTNEESNSIKLTKEELEKLAEEKDKLKKEEIKTNEEKLKQLLKANEDYFNALNKLADDNFEKQLTDNEKELLAIDKKYEALYQLADDTNKDTTELQLQHADELSALIETQEVENAKELANKLLALRKEFNLLTNEELFAIAQEELIAKNEWQLLSEEEQLIALQELRESFREDKKEADKLDNEVEVQLLKQKEDRKRLILEESFNFLNNLKDAYINKQLKNEDVYYDRQIKNAGDNDELKEQIEAEHQEKIRKIRLKAEVMEFVVNAAKIVALTLVGNAQAVAQLGPIPAIPVVAANFVSMGVQLAALAAQKAIVMSQFEKGKYDVIGADDGKTYSAGYKGTATTGMVNEPSVFLAGEKPEMIIDNPTLQNLQINYPGIIDAINNSRVPQFQTGNINTTIPTNATNTNQTTVVIDIALVNAINNLNNSIRSGIKANVLYTDISEVGDKVTAIKNTANIG